MTEKEAKELTLEVWRYLAEHPKINSKGYLPKRIVSRIRDYRNSCPLCSLFYGHDAVCPRCPLGRCTDKHSLFGDWFYGNESQRKAAAQEIVKVIEAWEPGMIDIPVGKALAAIEYRMDTKNCKYCALSNLEDCHKKIACRGQNRKDGKSVIFRMNNWPPKGEA